MTREEVLAMKAGPELDSLLAPLVGYTVEQRANGVEGCAKACCCVWENAAGNQITPLPLSETWEGMQLVVEALRAKDYALSLDSPGGHYTAWRARIFAPCGGWQAVASTAPHAVAVAAMLAVGGGDAR